MKILNIVTNKKINTFSCGAGISRSFFGFFPKFSLDEAA